MADTLQLLEDTPGRPQASFKVQNVATDLDGPAGGTCTVTLTRPDGTAGPAAGTVTHVSTGVYEITVDGSTDPYWYDVEWAGTISAKTVKVHTRVEWIGAFLFNVGDLRAHQPVGGSTLPFNDTTKYPDAKLHQIRTEVLGEFTKRLGFSPVRRYAYEVYSLDRPGRQVILKRLFAGKLLSVSVAGVTQSVSDYYIGEGGVLLPVSGYTASAWGSSGYGVVAVGYTNGWDSFEDDQGREVALLRAAMKLIPGISSTVTGYASPDGGNYTWDRAGSRNLAGEKVYFGVGAIAEWLNEHRAASIVVA